MKICKRSKLFLEAINWSKITIETSTDRVRNIHNDSTMNWHNILPLSWKRFWDYFIGVGVLAFTYFTTAKLALVTLDLGAEASPLWPPAGVALAALLLHGQCICPGVALGAALFAKSLGVSWIAAWSIAGGSAVQAVIGTQLLRQMGFRSSLKRVQDVLQLLVLGAWVSPIVNATISTIIGCSIGTVAPSQAGKNWGVLWLGDGMGIIVVTPAILVLSHTILRVRWLIGQQARVAPNLGTSQTRFKPKHWIEIATSTFRISHQAEAIVCFPLLCAIGWLVFGSKTADGIAQYPLEYLPFPLVVWAALRWQQLGAVIATLMISAIAIGGAVRGVGPFVAQTGGIDIALQFLLCFMGVVAMVALLLAAAEAERTSAVDLLKEREASLANAQRLAKLGNWDYYETCQDCSQSQWQLRWSDELYRLFGFAAGAFQPSWQAFFQVVHPADREQVGQAIRGALREQKPYCIDYRIVLPDGSQRVVCEQSEISQDGISGTVQDITDRKQVEAQLRAVAQRDRLLGEMAMRIRRSLNLDCILNTTVAEVRQFLKADRVFIGQIQRVAQEWKGSKPPVTCAQDAELAARLKGLIIAEAVEPSYPSLCCLTIDDERTLQFWQSQFAQNCAVVLEDTEAIAFSPKISGYHCEYQVRAILGVPIWVGDELYGALVVNQCQQPRQWQSWEIDWLCSLATQVAIAIQQAQLYRQITDLNTHLESQVAERTQELSAKMAELQELNHLKDVFLQAVSHDLRTSLLGMSMVFNNLYRSAEETVTLSRPLLERMMMSSERQVNLIDSLLEDHFHEKRQLDLHCQPIKLDGLIHNLIADYLPILTQNQATLTQHLPTVCPAIMADPKLLRRVLENLLANAIKHNPPGLNLTLQIAVEDERIRCTLQDDGVGMPQAQQNSLFKLYIRGLHTKHLTGIGLGLYQCRQIIHAHGGEIGAISTPKAGSTFWFTLPLAKTTARDGDVQFVGAHGCAP
ncbi:MAG TPA: MASE1 domain-containing protein [Allocoleopsis sp.]